MIHSTNTYLNNVLYRCDICVHDWLNAEQSILELELGLEIELEPELELELKLERELKLELEHHSELGLEL